MATTKTGTQDRAKSKSKVGDRSTVKIETEIKTVLRATSSGTVTATSTTGETGVKSSTAETSETEIDTTDRAGIPTAGATTIGTITAEAAGGTRTEGTSQTDRHANTTTTPSKIVDPSRVDGETQGEISTKGWN